MMAVMSILPKRISDTAEKSAPDPKRTLKTQWLFAADTRWIGVMHD